MALPDPRKRVFYVDVIRAYAIFWVVVSHVFAPICWGMKDYPLGIWWLYNVLDSIMRLTVPLFVLISGKLILGSTRDEPYLHFIGKRLAKVVPPFFVWYMIYRFFDGVLHGADRAPALWIVDFLSGTTTYHLYFMYIILGLYLIAPFLRRYVQTVSLSSLRTVLFLWFGYLTLQFFFPDAYGNSGPASTLIGYGGYFLLGYYLDKEETFDGRTKALLGVSAVIVIFNAFATYALVVNHGGAMDERFYWGLTPLVVIYAGCFFKALKNIDYDTILASRPTVRRAVTYLSRDSYNIYLMHLLILWVLAAGSLGFTLDENTGGSALIGVPLTAAVIMGASLGLSRPLQKIPVLSRLFVIPAA